MARDRFSPRIAAKENATQRIPGAISERSTLLGSNAKLNIVSTSTPNISIELTDSLLRISMTMSLKMMAVTGFIGQLRREYMPRRHHGWRHPWNCPRRQFFHDQ